MIPAELSLEAGTWVPAPAYFAQSTLLLFASYDKYKTEKNQYGMKIDSSI